MEKSKTTVSVSVPSNIKTPKKASGKRKCRNRRRSRRFGRVKSRQSQSTKAPMVGCKEEGEENDENRSKGEGDERKDLSGEPVSVEEDADLLNKLNGEEGDSGACGASGCPSSSSVKLSREKFETCETERVELMPVTSRSKRLRGATSASGQHKKTIAYTDRKTRSASSSISSSGFSTSTSINISPTVTVQALESDRGGSARPLDSDHVEDTFSHSDSTHNYANPNSSAFDNSKYENADKSVKKIYKNTKIGQDEIVEVGQCENLKNNLQVLEIVSTEEENHVDEDEYVVGLEDACVNLETNCQKDSGVSPNSPNSPSSSKGHKGPRNAYPQQVQVQPGFQESQREFLKSIRAKIKERQQEQDLSVSVHGTANSEARTKSHESQSQSQSQLTQVVPKFMHESYYISVPTTSTTTGTNFRKTVSLKTPMIVKNEDDKNYKSFRETINANTNTSNTCNTSGKHLQNLKSDFKSAIAIAPSASVNSYNFIDESVPILSISEKVGSGICSASSASVISGGGSKRVKKLIDEKKSSLAPMLLMNNLPYMGELTFDTRPRRGRKPKKADICHLISKNYGIHFPNSYTNIPNTGSPPVPVDPSGRVGIKRAEASATSTSTSTSVKVAKSSRKFKSSTFSSSPPSSKWQISPPDLLPISRQLSLGNSPTPQNYQQLSQYPPKSSKQRLTEESITMSKLTTNLNVKEKREDEPLNLCVRDGSSTSQQLQGMGVSINRSFCDFNENYTDILNHKLPHLSSNLYGEFQLQSSLENKLNQQNQQGSRRKAQLQSNSPTSAICRKFKTLNSAPNILSYKISKSSRENTTGDSNLVNQNQTNYKINLANATPEDKKGQAFRFTLPVNADSNKSHFLSLKRNHNSVGGGGSGGASSGNTDKKSRKRRSPSDKLESSSQSLKVPNAQSGKSPSQTLDSHAGGSLFGQSDSGSNSCAQVSICKFKFTGGAKPSLQEKKMLSVDSGGNFRFYTDKSCGSSSVRSVKNCPGSQQPSFSSNPSSTSGESNVMNNGEQYAFSTLPKSAKSMSVCMPVRPTSLQITENLEHSQPQPQSQHSRSHCPSTSTASKIHVHSNSQESHSLSKSPLASTSTASTSSKSKSPSQTAISPTAHELNKLSLDIHNHNLKLASGGYSPSAEEGDADQDGYSSSQSSDLESGSGLGPTNPFMTSSLSHSDYDSYRSRKLRSKRKRRTRKSLMREKLEKTFKEKGFLIQTQQLESAEGATYCKFRQLRKFTRYLFRSWKDYLPDNVKEINNAAREQGLEGEGANLDLENLENLENSHGEEKGSPGLNLNSAGGNGEDASEMELDLTTNSHQHLHHHSSNENENEDGDGDGNGDGPASAEELDDGDEEDDDEHCELVPEVTLITQPSSPATMNSNNESGSEASNVSVDVDGDAEGTSNSSLPYNNSIHNVNINDNDTHDSIDNS